MNILSVLQQACSTKAMPKIYGTEILVRTVITCDIVVVSIITAKFLCLVYFSSPHVMLSNPIGLFVKLNANICN